MKKVIAAIVLLVLMASCEKKELMDDNILNGTYAKKFHIIHYKTIPMYDVDKNSFQILSFDYAKDKNHVYFGDEEIKNADFKYKDRIDAIVNINLDTKTLKSEGLVDIKSFLIAKAFASAA